MIAFDRAIWRSTAAGQLVRHVHSATQPGPDVPDDAALPMARRCWRRRLQTGSWRWDAGAAPTFDGRPDACRACRSWAPPARALTQGRRAGRRVQPGATAPQAFAAVDRRLLARVGTHLALAIDNARLYDEIKRMHLSNLKASARRSTPRTTTRWATPPGWRPTWCCWARSWAGPTTCCTRSKRPPTCTTSARSASPTACCSSPAG